MNAYHIKSSRTFAVFPKVGLQCRLQLINFMTSSWQGLPKPEGKRRIRFHKKKQIAAQTLGEE